ncbi:hypothetical protein SK128_009949, partial [Halocaridina rubra]
MFGRLLHSRLDLLWAEQTGPLSYCSSLPLGVVMRHQDQIIPRNQFPPETNAEVIVPTIPNFPNPPPISVDIPAGTSDTGIEILGNAPVETIPQLLGSPRRSFCVRKPMD